MANNEIIGRCQICGKQGKLTFEHIPPRCAMNSEMAVIYSGYEVIDFVGKNKRIPKDNDGLRGKRQPRGTGSYTLCKECNNLMGSYYGNEYKKVFRAIIIFVVQNYDSYLKADKLHIEIPNVYPMRFAKQLLSLFCSTDPGLAIQYPIVKELLLDKNMRCDNLKELSIHMSVLKKIYNGTTGKIGAIKRLDGTGELKSSFSNEIAAFPMLFTLSYSGVIPDLDITDLLSYDYHKKEILTLDLNIKEKTFPFPSFA